MKTKRFFSLFAIMTFLLGLCACETVDYESLNGSGTSSTTKITQPELERYLTTTTTDMVSLRCRFNNGGDTWDNMNCIVHWRRYASKPSTTPKASDMNQHETMRQYATTSRSTTFDKTHAGFSGGTYVYYYFECSNSKYTTKTDVTFCVVKR